MLTVTEARALVLGTARSLGTESIPLNQTLGRVSAEPLSADRPLPPFDRITMDGYAVRAVDLTEPKELKLTGCIAAGDKPGLVVEPGCCIQVMTGAPMPAGGDAVIEVESTEKKGTHVLFNRPAKQHENIVPTGSEAQPGQEFFPAGQPVTAQLLAFLASIGKSELTVYRQPQVAVISTGNELVPLGRPPEAYQIRDCNSWSVFGQANELGMPVQSLGIAGDSEEELKEKITAGLATTDILLLSGGVSMGEWDLVPQVLESLGIKKGFHKVKLKPGKPVWFGTGSGKWVFGLPGNPVSVQACFKLFVEPLILALSGHPDPEPQAICLPLNKGIHKRTDRESYVCAQLVVAEGKTWVEEVRLGGSGDFSGLGFSQGMFRFDADIFDLNQGDLVWFVPWRRF